MAYSGFGNAALAGVGLQMVWGGIASATLPDKPARGLGLDSTISDFSVLGASGTDWRQAVAVPEPATWALLLAGLLLTGAARRGRISPCTPEGQRGNGSDEDR